MLKQRFPNCGDAHGLEYVINQTGPMSRVYTFYGSNLSDGTRSVRQQAWGAGWKNCVPWKDWLRCLREFSIDILTSNATLLYEFQSSVYLIT